MVYLIKKYYLQSDRKYYGEFEGLEAIRNTKTVKAPRPVVVGLTDDKSKHLLVLEFMNLTSLEKKSSAKLGIQLADMHLFNLQHNSSLVIIQFFRINFFSICLFSP